MLTCDEKLGFNSARAERLSRVLQYTDGRPCGGKQLVDDFRLPKHAAMIGAFAKCFSGSVVLRDLESYFCPRASEAAGDSVRFRRKV